MRAWTLRSRFWRQQNPSQLPPVLWSKQLQLHRGSWWHKGRYDGIQPKHEYWIRLWSQFWRHQASFHGDMVKVSEFLMWCAPLFRRNKTPKHGYAVIEHTCLSSNNCFKNMQLRSASHSRDNMNKCLIKQFFIFLFESFRHFFTCIIINICETQHKWRVGSHPTAGQQKCFSVHVGPVNMVTSCFPALKKTSSHSHLCFSCNFLKFSEKKNPAWISTEYEHVDTPELFVLFAKFNLFHSERDRRAHHCQS